MQGDIVRPILELFLCYIHDPITHQFDLIEMTYEVFHTEPNMPSLGNTDEQEKLLDQLKFAWNTGRWG